LKQEKLHVIKFKLLGSLFMPTSKHWEMIPVYKWSNILDIWTSRFFRTEDHIFGLETHLQHYTVPSSTVVNLSLNIH